MERRIVIMAFWLSDDDAVDIDWNDESTFLRNLAILVENLISVLPETRLGEGIAQYCSMHVHVHECCMHACLLIVNTSTQRPYVHYSCHVLLTATPVDNIESDTCSSGPLKRVNQKLPGIAFRDNQWKCLCCDIVVCVQWLGAPLILIVAESTIAGCLVL